MPIDLVDLAVETKEFDCEFMGQSMPVVYRPAVLTGRFVARMEKGDTVEAVGKMLCELLVSWDVQKDGEVVELSPDAIMDLPLALLQGISRGCMDDSGVDESGKGNRAQRRRKNAKSPDSETNSFGS